MFIECRTCDGIGEVYVISKGRMVKCSDCDGTGRRELPEPGPIVPSPMIETMEGYDRKAWNYERRKEVPR